MRRLSSVITPRHWRWWSRFTGSLVLVCVVAYTLQVWQHHDATPARAWVAVLPGWLVALAVGRRLRRGAVPLVDEVWVQDHLLWIGRGELRASIDLAHLSSVRADPRLRHPPRIELALDADGPFGSRFAFLAPPFHGAGRHPVVLELERRRAVRVSRLP